MALAIIAFGAIFLLLASAGLLLFYRNAALQRLASVVAPRTESRRWSKLVKENPAESVQSILAPFQNVLPRSAAEVSVLQTRLTRAGYRGRTYVNIFYAAKVVVPLALCATAFLTGIHERLGLFFTLIVCGGVGFMVPDFWLGNRVSNRQAAVRLGLPEALDLMVICTEAGLGLDQCLMRVARELEKSQPEIADEFGLVHLEQKAGYPRADALKNLAARTDVDSVRALVQTLIQSDSFGSSIAKTLRVYSDTLRTQRRQKAEEQAAKTTVKLVFPLALFIFPTIFIVVLGPAGIAFMEGAQFFINSMPATK